MERVPVEECMNENGASYLSHHAVIKEFSTSTRLRVLFDESCKTDSGVSIKMFCWKVLSCRMIYYTFLHVFVRTMMCCPPTLQKYIVYFGYQKINIGVFNGFFGDQVLMSQLQLFNWKLIKILGTTGLELRKWSSNNTTAIPDMSIIDENVKKKKSLCMFPCVHVRRASYLHNMAIKYLITYILF